MMVENAWAALHPRWVLPETVVPSCNKKYHEPYIIHTGIVHTY